MKQRRKSLYYSKNRVSQLPIRREILMFSILLLSGLLIGVLVSKNGNESIFAQVSRMFDSFYSVRENQSIGASVINSLKVSCAFWLINVLFGLCIIGIPFVTVIPVIRGLGIGLVTGYIYSIYGIKGVGYCFLIIFPGALISFIALIYAVSDSFKMSLYTLSSCVNSVAPKGGAEKIKIFAVRQMFYLMLFAVSAFIDGIANKLFAGVFNF